GLDSIWRGPAAKIGQGGREGLPPVGSLAHFGRSGLWNHRQPEDVVLPWALSRIAKCRRDGPKPCPCTRAMSRWERRGRLLARNERPGAASTGECLRPQLDRCFAPLVFRQNCS